MPDMTPAVPVTGTWYRHVPAGVPPLTVRRPAPDGRWQRGEEIAGLYLAADAQTLWAEWYRALAELAVPPDAKLPRDLWRFELTLERVADLTGRGALRALGLPAPRPDRGQWPAFQDAGARLAAAGFQAVLFKSSARPAGRCLCLFTAADAFSGIEPSGKPEQIAAAPAPPRGMRT